MELTSADRNETPAFVVSIRRDGELLHSAWFSTQEEAAVFVEEWSDRTPNVRAEIEDRTGDHTAWETFETATAVPEDHFRDSPAPEEQLIDRYSYEG